MSPNLIACRLVGRAFMGLVLCFLIPEVAGSHCDTMDGPVVADAKLAL